MIRVEFFNSFLMSISLFFPKALEEGYVIIIFICLI